MTPLTYDQFAIRPMWLPTPERSLFTTNLGLNRQIGAMGWGYLFDRRLDYAVGVFNGSRNSFQSLGHGMDFISFVNARPFQDSESLWFLQFLNVGTSVAYGYQDQPPVPASFRIGAVSPDAAVPGVATVPFLILNPDVVERGDRLLGSVHAAYFFKGLSLLGEWQYGYNSYATASRPFARGSRLGILRHRGLLPDRRARRKPDHDPAASATHSRRARADPWAGRLGGRGPGQRAPTWREGLHLRFRRPEPLVEFGHHHRARRELVLERVLQDLRFWLHGEFGDPVQFRPGGFQKNADMFWLRFQLWF